jgi:hypothetical protein
MLNILPVDLRDQLCDALAGILRGLGIDANNKDSMPSVAAQAMNSALRYAKDGQLKSQLLKDKQAAENNKAAKVAARGSGCCIPFILLGALGLMFLFMIVMQLSTV